ncbi:EAL domain-containing protein [Sedimenticola sp.]|uniref:EAL domain-containing protein n=1 Tax=Sedimenticola sp. TaxID=1940285 RepID=UPI0025865BCD|nr:EAL domain-containing protein [Sedimenticola sp.]MCW8902853.1 EAL domain-containing protein [Sedimenticola sp.]
MIGKLGNCSLYRQLIIPMFSIGLISLLGTVYFSHILKESVAALDTVYVDGDIRLRNLEKIEKQVTAYRALSLRHLTTESFSAMEEISQELDRTRLAIIDTLPASRHRIQLHEYTTPQTNDYSLDLSGILNTYFREIGVIIKLSADFEKEAAFVLLSRTESEYIPRIKEITSQLIRHEFGDIAASRQALMSVATHNLYITIAIGVGGGGSLLFIAFIVIRNVTRQLSQLLVWSQKISLGDYSAPLIQDSSNEVGQLTDAMAEMAQSISDAHNKLEMSKRSAESIAETLKIYANAFEYSGEAILITDRDNHIINVNRAFTKQTGYELSDVAGKNPRMLSGGDTSVELYREMWRDLERDSFWQGELWDRKKSGEIYPKWAAISAIRDQAGEVLFHIASFTDISDRKAAEARIEHLAHYDMLTGLLNRFSLESRMEQAVLAAKRDQQQLAVLFVDLDRFKYINDSMGHHIGDQLLIEVANRLKNCLRESDIVARIGGDEFVIVLTGLKEMNQVPTLARYLIDQLSQPYSINDNVFDSSPSIGISIYPNDGESIDELLKTSDIAMYHAKDQGRKNFQFFTESLLVASEERLDFEHQLRSALELDQFELYYQAQVHTRGSQIYGMEALIRWNHPTRGFIGPDRFIPIAEEIDVIHELGAWVIDMACRQLAIWKQATHNPLQISVNLSAKQLHSDTLIQTVRTAIEKHQIRDGELELEITETVAMSDPELAIQQLNGLSQLGVSLAIDDFGTGYSSLAYLKKLPINTLKLDRAFVGDIENDRNDAEICMATIALAHNLGLKVVAEGVETTAQRDFLTEHCCDYLQGYLFSKPVPPEAAGRLLFKDASNRKSKPACKTS